MISVCRRHFLISGSAASTLSFLSGCFGDTDDGADDSEHQIDGCDQLIVYHMPEYVEEEGVPEETDIVESTDAGVRDAEPIQKALDRVLDPEYRLEESTNGWDTFIYYMDPDPDEEAEIIEALQTFPSMYDGEPHPGWFLEHEDEIAILQCLVNL